MHKRLLPIILAFIILSCNKPAPENSTTADSSSIGELPPGEDPNNDTAYNGNTDGDYFFSETDSVEDAVDDNRFVSEHTSELEIDGFDNSGKYLVFSQVVPGDYGGGAGYIYIIDAAKNEWSTKPFATELSDVDYTVDDLKQLILSKKDSVLRKHNIKLGANAMKTFDLTSGHSVTINNQSYNVDLQVVNLMIELRLKGNGKDILLQKDSKVPASRGAVTEYRLSKAVTSGDKIAVFVEYDGEIQSGFENSRYYDRKYIAVTGVVK